MNVKILVLAHAHYSVEVRVFIILLSFLQLKIISMIIFQSDDIKNNILIHLSLHINALKAFWCRRCNSLLFYISGNSLKLVIGRICNAPSTIVNLTNPTKHPYTIVKPFWCRRYSHKNFYVHTKSIVLHSASAVTSLLVTAE